jgi:hypothetical protein
MKIDLSNKNRTVFELVKMMKYKNKAILFTGRAIEKKAAYIKELQLYYASKLTINTSTIPTVLPETVRLVIAENVTSKKSLNKWYKLHTEGFTSEIGPHRKVTPHLVIVTSIEKDKLNSFRPEILGSFEFIELS